MKKQILVFSALLIVALFTACEQDSLISTDVSEDVIAEYSLEIEAELPPELAALINGEEASMELRSSCSFPYGGGSYTKVASDPFGGPMGFYSGQYRFSGRNNSFPPANEIVDYTILVTQQKNNGDWVYRNHKCFDNVRTFVWTDPNMYRSTNGYTRNLKVIIGAKGQGCPNTYKVIYDKKIVM